MASKPWGFFAVVVTYGLVRAFADWRGRAGGSCRWGLFSCEVVISVLQSDYY